MSNTDPKELYQEYIPNDEKQKIQSLIELSAYFHQKQYEAIGKYRRGQHTKDTGCVKAEFIIKSGLAENLKYGVFREAKTFEAIVRFSNGSSQLRSDRVPDGRGMAIKLLNVEGTKVLSSEELKAGQDKQQDFIMVNNPTFAFSNVEDYHIFFSLRKSLVQTLGDDLGNKLARLVFFLPRPKKAKIVKATTDIPVANALDIQYWSMSPYSLGTQAIKFSAKPQAKHSNTSQENGDSLFKALEETLKQEDVYFDFLIQLQSDPQKTPIEDVSQEWLEIDSPFHTVATVKIPRQDLQSSELQNFRQQCESLSWNPWHALVEHKPLGGINRLRRAVYADSVKRRLQ